MRKGPPRRPVRRGRLRGLVLGALCGLLAGGAQAGGRSHGLSAFGDLKYAADFDHFNYVNPDAPKGGRMAMIGPASRTTFDSFNAFLLKGDAAQGLELIFDSLMTRAFDEPDAVYGLVAEWAEVGADGHSVTFGLREAARFADGTPVTADDVVYSFETLKTKGHPSFGIALRDVSGAQALDGRTVRYTFKGDLVRDLPLTVAALPVISRTWYASHAFDESSLIAPLGSGPYQIAAFKAGTFNVMKRRPDYWAANLPVNRGRFNLDEVRYDYFRDRAIELENLKGGSIDMREEFTSKDWATGYDIAAVRDGRLQRLTLPDATPSGTQGFFLNTRRAKFADARVRHALDLAFDFEWTNRNLFFGAYKRTTSYFQNSDMVASGPPSPAELALLEPYRSQLPADVFGAPYAPPVTDGTGQDRGTLRMASKLLEAAGYTIRDGRRVNARGETLDIEFLVDDTAFERIVGPYVKNLASIGVQASMRRVDSAQYESRLKSFDFDAIVQRYSMRLTPGVELKNYFGSESAKTDGSFNLAGIKDATVDALIDKAMQAGSRAELTTAARAIDRVLRAGHYWVPHWYKAAHTIAVWNRYAWPQVKPPYDRGAPDTWWLDAAKDAKLRVN